MLKVPVTAVTVLLVASTGAASDETARDIVRLNDGIVQGVVNGSYRFFKGIPYASPPLKELRFAPPTPPVKWHGVLNATTYKHNCLQSSSFDPAQPRNTLSEDCLYLNVFTPVNATSADRLPVMFWVHGGGYQGGGANESRLNGIYDVALTSDMIVVVINYRLNVFGFLAGEALRAKDVRGGTGNYGILDQRMALSWVQDNIQAFGGDPNKVMLVGESAGGASVANHLVRNASFGLFQSAGIESGGYTLVDPQSTPDEFEQSFQSVLKQTNCSSSENAVSCLENLDADTLMKVDGRFEPVEDGIDLPDQIASLMQRGNIAPGVPLLVGSVREDLTFMLPNIECRGGYDTCSQSDFEQFASKVHKLFPAMNVTEFVAIYNEEEVKLPGGNYTKWYWAAQHAGADASMICPARRSAIWHTAASAQQEGVGSFLFLFTHVPEGPSGSYPKLAHHSSEIPFVFHVLHAEGPNAAKYHLYSPAETRLSTAMVEYWRNMAASGDPNIPPKGVSAPAVHWPAYRHSSNSVGKDNLNVASDTTMVFGDELKVVHGLKRKQCDFWDKLMEY